MSDLISRSQLLKHCHRVTEYDEAGFSMEYNAVSVEDIKNAPTAYDVDKVVKELEEKKHNFSGGSLQTIYYWRGIEEAIEIVKGVMNERD